jgi:hypothetical protein
MRTFRCWALLVVAFAFAYATSAPPAFAACPPNAEAYRESRQGKELTVHCRCIVGYENKSGRCVKAETSIVPPGTELKDAMRKKDKRDKCINTEVVQISKDGYRQLRFRGNGCPENIAVSVCLWLGNKPMSRQPLTTVPIGREKELDLNFGVLTTESADQLMYQWSTDGDPCHAGRPMKLPQLNRQ